MNEETYSKCHALRDEADRQKKWTRELKTQSQALIERAKECVVRATENAQALSAGRERHRKHRQGR